jgi:hypothetical protein
MLPVVVYGTDNGAVVAALVGAAAALIVAVLGGLFTYRATVHKARAEVAAAREGARALLEAAQRQAAATVEAAVEQAAAAREAGFRNAIETEAMKLRFQMAERHLDRFHERAGLLMAALMDLQRSNQGGDRYVQLMVHSPYDAFQEAELVARPEDWDRLIDARNTLGEACTSVHFVVVGGKGFVLPGNELPPVWTTERYTELSTSCSTAVAALQHIIAVVSVSSIMRAQGATSAESLALLATLYQKWEEKKALLKKLGTWGGRFVRND